MAQIPTYTASVATRSAGVPNTQMVRPDAAALSNVGEAVSDFAAVFQQKQDQRDSFKAENAYRNFELKTAQDLQEAERNAPVDGAGFHDGFIKNVYRPQRDAFLASVPERLRPKYAELLADDTGSASTAWSIKAAEKERDIGASWVKQELGVTQNQLASAIDQNPAAMEEYLQQGLDLVDRAPFMSAQEKAIAKQGWTTFAETAYLNRVMQDDPELLLRTLNANPNKLAPATQFSTLAAAIRDIESGGRAGAISPAGAVGEMQVMPGTARDIAKWMGDENFPTGGDPQQVTEYLLRPGVSKRYGEFYLNRMLKQFPNDIEAAAVAYNAGPGKAQEWIKAGRDDSVLAKETRDYIRKKLPERMPGLVAPGAQSMGTGKAPHVDFIFDRDGREPIAGQNLGKLNRDLVDRVSTAFAAVGLNQVKVNSGYRSPEDNRRVGGAGKIVDGKRVETSQHVHGNAMDIDITGYSQAQKVALIKSLSANGITGIGVSDRIIHADVGGRRSWGYPTIPKWAQPAIEEHNAGRAVPPQGGGRFSTLPYEQRQKFISAADQELSRRLTEQQRGTALERTEVRRDLELELDRIAKTGQGGEGFDETRISTVLGEDDYLKFADRKYEAERTYTATKDIALMSPEEMLERVDAYTANPLNDTFTSDQRVQAAVEKEVDRVTKLRASRPDRAAMEFPDVKQAYDKVQAAGAAGQQAEPADVQMMVALMLQRQKEFGVPDKALAPVPHEMAFEIGKTFTSIPKPGSKIDGKTVSDADIRAAVASEYNRLYTYYGEFTDEVITYAMIAYKALPPATAERVAELMSVVAQGGDDPFRLAKPPAPEPEPERWYNRAFREFGRENSLFGDGEEDAEQEDATVPDTTGAVDPELVMRAVKAWNELEDEPDAEAFIVRKYGQAAADAAKIARSTGGAQ